MGIHIRPMNHGCRTIAPCTASAKTVSIITIPKHVTRTDSVVTLPAWRPVSANLAIPVMAQTVRTLTNAWIRLPAARVKAMETAQTCPVPTIALAMTIGPVRTATSIAHVGIAPICTNTRMTVPTVLKLSIRPTRSTINPPCPRSPSTAIRRFSAVVGR